MEPSNYKYRWKNLKWHGATLHNVKPDYPTEQEIADLKQVLEWHKIQEAEREAKKEREQKLGNLREWLTI